MSVTKKAKLDQLVLSKNNVRKKQPSAAKIKALAASIKAIGLLQNLIVTEKDDVYYVEAGGCRLSALKLLKKEREIDGDYLVDIKVIDENSVASSLAENTMREKMNPVDEYEAFKKIKEKDGLSAKEIAVIFGQTEKYVLQRFKLASVDKSILDEYKAGKMDEEQLAAFTITDDKEVQKRVWEEVKNHIQCTPALIRRTISEDSMSSSSKLVKFIGINAYKKKGGQIINDLFSDEKLLSDVNLVHQLVEEKLEKECKKITGWKWVEKALDIDHSFTFACGSVELSDTKKTLELKEKENELQKKLEEMNKQFEEDETNETLEEEIQEIQDTLWDLDDEIEESKIVGEAEKEKSGCYVYINQEGKLAIKEGLIHPDDIKARAEESDDSSKPKKEEEKTEFSNTLITDLESQRLSITKAALSSSFDLCFDLVIYDMLASIAMRKYSTINTGALEGGFGNTFKDDAKGNITTSRSNVELVEKKEKALSKVNIDCDSLELLQNVRKMKKKDKEELFAVLVSESLKSSKMYGGDSMLDVVDKELNVSVREYWTPDNDNLFSRVGRDTILRWGKELSPSNWVDDETKLSKKELGVMLEANFTDETMVTPEQKEKVANWLPECM